jgi:pyruvate-formate lyase-activating enzyme
LKSYREGCGNTIISTHISPTAKCNLNCKYCSVSNREKGEEIPLSTALKYIIELKKRGLKAVVLTGGGEPTLYKDLDLLIYILKDYFDLKVGLITNGTTDNLDYKVVRSLDWVRISWNGKKIKFPTNNVRGTLGMSYIWDGQEEQWDNLENVGRKIGSEYIRVLPDCNSDNIEELHERLSNISKKYGFMHQHKTPSKSEGNICHQSYFRPYLSEIGGGTVFPCDSLVLNDRTGLFEDKYALCKAEDVKDVCSWVIIKYWIIM